MKETPTFKAGMSTEEMLNKAMRLLACLVEGQGGKVIVSRASVDLCEGEMETWESEGNVILELRKGKAKR